MTIPRPQDRLAGTVDLLVLRTLAEGPMHGWAISFHIRQSSGEVLRINQGALYPALHRLEDRGWVSAEWGVSDAGRRRRFSAPTPPAHRQLAPETEGWLEFVRAVQGVLQLAPA